MMPKVLARPVRFAILLSLLFGPTACKASAIDKRLDSQAAAYAKERAERPFMGSVAFDFEMIDEGAGGPPTTYSGVAYVGPDGTRRLDIRFGTDKPPVICAVLPGSAWMVFYKTEHSIESRLPVPSTNDGWANQLRAQVDQTSSWCGLLSALQVSQEILAFQSAEAPSSAPSDPDNAKRLTEVKTRLTGNAMASIELRYANGGKLEATDFRDIAGMGPMPHEYTRTNITDEGRVVKLHFEITEMSAAQDSDFEEHFAAPSRTPEKWPDLWGATIIEKDGKETLTPWRREIQVNNSPRS
ncbi:MAG: hypothetical protein IT449_17500 [Phycisphaerales bacterium]|nr:hypothetical protein [Phycisphaerales bacterium]